MSPLRVTPPDSDVVETLHRDGIYLLDDAITPRSVDVIRSEVEWFLTQDEPWCRPMQHENDHYVTIAPSAVPRKQQARMRTISALFSEGFFERVCKAYLAPDAIIDRIIISKSAVSDQPITAWHADQQNEGRLSFKFMLYLSDTTADSGAFSYVPGSHILVRELMHHAADDDEENNQVHMFDQIASTVDRFGDAEQKRRFDSIRQHVQGDYDSDDHYSIAAKKGSILLFDTKGIHRGGVVRQGERVLVRIHCFEPDRRPDRRLLARRLAGRLRSALKPKVFRWG